VTPIAHTTFLNFEIKIKPEERYRPTGPLVS